jgi:hypothetical protein
MVVIHWLFSEFKERDHHLASMVDSRTRDMLGMSLKEYRSQIICEMVHNVDWPLLSNTWTSMEAIL